MAMTFLRALGEELREGPLARAEIGDDHRRHEREEHVRDAFPSAAGAVGAAEFARELIEVLARFVLRAA